MAFQPSSGRVNYDNLLFAIMTVAVFTFLSTLVTCSSIPRDSSETIDTISERTSTILLAQSAEKATAEALASEIRLITGKLATLEQIVIADRNASLVPTLAPPRAQPPAEGEIPQGQPGRPPAAAQSIIIDLAKQSSLDAHAAESTRELNAVTASIDALTTQIETYRRNDAQWSQLGAGVSALTAFLVKFCVWTSWILTILTILLPRRYTAFIQHLPSLNSMGAAGKLGALTLTVAYLCLMIIGYGQSLSALLRNWYTDVLPLFYPLVAIFGVFALISNLRIHIAIKVIASIVSATLIVWGVLEASAHEVDPTLPIGQYYFQALLDYLSVVNWNYYAMWVSMLLLIIALYVARVAIIVIDFMRASRSDEITAT